MNSRILPAFILTLLGCSGLAIGDDSRKVEELTRDALEHGVSGNDALYQKLLTEALALDPDGKLANWHQRRINLHDQWLSLPNAENHLAQHEHYREYHRRLAFVNGDPKRELETAKWCAAHQLADYAKYHFRQVVVHPASNPKMRSEALQRLGLRQYQGQWLTEAELAAHRQQEQQLERATKKWKSRVLRWAKALGRGSKKQIEYAQGQLDEIDDLSIIPVLEQFLSTAGENQALTVVTWLSTKPPIQATESLLKHARFGLSANVQNAATNALSDRQYHDFVPQLLAQLVPPIESRFAIRLSPTGGVLHRHQLFRSGQTHDELTQSDFHDTTWRVVSNSGNANRPIGPNTRFMKIDPLTGAQSLDNPIKELSEARQRMELLALEAMLRSVEIEQNVGKANQLVTEHNAPYYRILSDTTAEAIPNDPELWWDWWDTYNESYVPPKPTRFRYGRRLAHHGPTYYRLSCFAAGTPVRTDSGLVPIERIRPGQRVLSQDIDSGELTYKLVWATTRRPDAPLVEVTVGDNSIVATKGHPLWVNGQGWRMVKRLVVGDVLHTLEGPRRIEQIRTFDPAPAYNLVVDSHNTYFVGELGVLAHDNQPRQPTVARVPGYVKN